MKDKLISRREFAKKTTWVSARVMAFPVLNPTDLISVNTKKRNLVSLSTNFKSGGGQVELINSDPVTIHLSPHNQKDGGWSQVWWYFKATNLTPGEEVTILLDLGNPRISGINPKIKFSYDQQVWGLTNAGQNQYVEGKEYFVYKHIVKGKKTWFAYDLPYHDDHLESLLISKASNDASVEVMELCRSKGNNPVKALVFNKSDQGEHRYGIWLQARAHAFESGSSWVLNELATWLLSGSREANALRNIAQIIILPIIDVDGVNEGRTGKMQHPYDHNRGWNIERGYWPEVRAIKSGIKELSLENNMDLFIDFHGPGNQKHPYFIIPHEEDLPFPLQRTNRFQFLETLKAKPFDEELEQTHSMTQFCYSARSKERISDELSASWVTMNSTPGSIALTLEVNMNTPLSTWEGYRAEGIILGKAISNYFVGNHHHK